MSFVVLLVDSDTQGPCSARETLHRLGHDVITCDSSEKALAMIGANPGFDLIVYSCAGNGHSPSTFCQQIRQEDRARHIPVLIAVTENAHGSDIEESLRAGADGVFTIHSATTAFNIAAEAMKAARPKPSVVLDDELRGLLKDYSALSHAVNNPLQAILANTDLISLRLPEDSPLRKYTQSIAESGDRISKMVYEASQKAKAILSRGN